MEGAGASIFSHAAELATREMDSAHEEPELPSAIQDLVQRLEGQGEPITQLPNLRDPEFREFFPEFVGPWTIIGGISQVRRRVLEAIGSCNTFEILDVHHICDGNISRLTPSEWEVVLRGFRSSTVLEKIIVHGTYLGRYADSESLCFQLGRILNSSSVTELKLGGRLSARCLSNLASGLRGRSDSKLKSLDLRVSWEDSSGVKSAVKYVADMINSAPLLETLRLGGRLGGCWEYMEDETVGILSQALNQSLALKEFTLDQAGEWAGPLLLKALAGDDRNRSIERLRLLYVEGLGDWLRELLISNPSLKEVELHPLSMEPEKAHQLGEAIHDNAIATTILVRFKSKFDEDWESVEALARSASSEVNDPTLEITLHVDTKKEVMLSLNLLGRVLRGEITSLKSLSISDRFSILERPEGILSMNGRTGETCVLKRLRLSALSEHVWNGVWKDLLLCLRGNTSLTHLDLSKTWLDEETFRDMMGLLQQNLSLQEINVSETSWAIDGKAALIQEALKQNEKRAAYMSVFREAGLAFRDAKAGRLFLCGSPLAGKTQLRQTLMRIVEGKSWLGNKWNKLFRTKGIEVEYLQNNDKRQISIWDLAGQEIFRTLQTVLFPQSNNFCVFLFVYSSFCENSASKKEDSCFRTELEEWMSFITSSSRVTGHNRPQVLVVISHKDKSKSSSLTWAHSIVKDVNQRFAKFVDLHPIQECFYVDTRKKKQVIDLKDYIFEIFDKLLSEKSPRVPQLCSRLSSLLATNIKENRSCPIWLPQKFNKFCDPILTEFISSSSAFAIDHSRILNSIVSYLNDVGSIVYIPTLSYIIVDPNWLTNTLLGELVALGQKFHAQEHESKSHSSYSSKDGFVSESVFVGLIEEFLGKQPHGQIGVDRDVIENILIHLDLCFKVEDTSQFYFIPSFIPEHASNEEQKPQEGKDLESMAWESRGETSQFVGIRIQCQDGRTMSLTAAFFPCFQMFMRRKLISEMRVSKKTVTCSRQYLRLFLDGHEIYVEQGTSHNYMDVLMLRSKHKSRSEALQYLMKHIVQVLISFCASSKGCPGVALVLSVIQTSCVEMLIPSHLRGAILIEELKSNFIDSINDKLEDIQLDRFHMEKEEALFSYEHSWPSIEGHTGVIFESARDLLWESDVEAVVNEIRQKRMQQLESLQQGLIEVNNDLNHSHPENENMVSRSSFPDMKQSNRPSSMCLSRASTNVQHGSIGLENKIDQLVQKVDGLDQRLRLMDIKVEQILSLQQEVKSTFSAFMSKVDRIIEYPQSLQQAGTPKRPYVKDDVGLFYKMSAHLHVGKTVRLHLMCESATGFHIVKDQEGLKIRVDLNNRAWISKTIEISLKVMYYAVKAGLDVTFGLGQAIPDWADLKSDIVKLDGISYSDRSAVLKGGESMKLKEAWLRIQQTLAPQLRDRYSTIFKLYQVKYVRLELGGHAWVCEECMSKGIRARILVVN
ncbi:hypothetical protein MPTK1_4g13180 [Marchantia polymorpha subsp. ruderalis]|uniref:C-terminal of Roc (COR) domain-containing protein n=1 Tax=Marchantia polymorpha subsp. ruderalis TaxID=1480154 RepID=A0AAF6B9F7_MARPO|nr:hypothetical protein Mp_4g13180 [Marchantia polymorpha subsp. ruderalis]